jgi:hypothetical protein
LREGLKPAKLWFLLFVNFEWRLISVIINLGTFIRFVNHLLMFVRV